MFRGYGRLFVVSCISLSVTPPALAEPVPGKAESDSKAKKPARTNCYGDPLPEGAMARLGTVRFRHAGIVKVVAFSPDGKILASGSNDHTVRLWETATGKELRRFVGHEHDVISLSFSPDGRTLASGAYDRAVCLWEVKTAREIWRYQGDKEDWGWGMYVAFSPDSKMLAVAGKETPIEWHCQVQPTVPTTYPICR
jgi:WD40 repeat protein